MTDAYPMRTAPFFRDYLWGGRNLQTVLGKAIPEDGVWAESWEIIDHTEHQSRVTNGALKGRTLRDLALSDPDWLFGNIASQLEALPLLLKYLDCQRVLSVQVHPDDDYAAGMQPPDLGKTEAWYVISAQPGAKLYAGLKEGVDVRALKFAIEAGTLQDCLHVIEPQAGECVFIPAGTVHALGAGVLVAEIQQASNTTFRLFDWNRVDKDGIPRALHVSQGLDVIDFERGPCEIQTPQTTRQAGRTRLVECEKFVLDRLQSPAEMQIAGDQRFHLLTAPHGPVEIRWDTVNHSPLETLQVGESVLLPAAMPPIEVTFRQPQSVLLDMYLPG